MSATPSHDRLAAPDTRGVARSLGRIRATHASLAADRLRLEVSRLAMERSYAVLAAPLPRVGPGGPGASPPATGSPAPSPPRDAADTPDADGPGADELRRRMMDGLQLILGLIERRLRRAEGTEAREALSALLRDVSALGAMQRRFAEGDTGGLADGLADLGAAWRRLAAGRGISVEVQAEPVAVDERQAIALALAANELVAGSLKHAFADGGRGRVSVALRGGGGGWGELRVADDGRGLVDGMGPDSLGLGLIAGLLRRVGAELRLEGTGATRAWMRFPVAGHAEPGGPGPSDGAADGAPRPQRPA